MRLVAFGEVGNQEAELVAAEPRVQILCAPRPDRTLLRDEVVGPHLFAQQRGHALDDPIADRVAERVVVPLEPGDVDEADRAPPAALLEREKRLELLGEAAKFISFVFGSRCVLSVRSATSASK